MVVEHTFDNGILEIKPIGRLDSSTANEFDEKVRAEIGDEVETLVINMGEVDYISSKGVRILVSLYKTMKGKKMILTQVNDSIVEVLRLSGLLKVFEVNPTGE